MKTLTILNIQHTVIYNNIDSLYTINLLEYDFRMR